MAKTNVNYVKTVYGVNEKERTVTCVIDYEILLDNIPSIAELMELDEFNEFMTRLVYQHGVKYIDKGRYGALQFRSQDIAFCADEDTFDIEIGKRLAQTRAQKLAFRNTKYFYNDIADMWFRRFEMLVGMSCNCCDCEIDCHEHEFELTNSVR